MRQVLISLMVLSLLPALAGAGVTNPDGFEGYALTDAWKPFIGADGWWCYGEQSQQGAAGNSFEIVAGSLPANTSQVVKVSSPATEFPGQEPPYAENLSLTWYQSIADVDGGPVTTTSFEFTSLAAWNETEYRMSTTRHAGVYYYYSWHILVSWGEIWGGGVGVPAATFNTYDLPLDYTGNPYDEDKYHRETIPGMGTFAPGDGVWYVVEVQEDNGTYDYDAWVADPVNNHGSSARARIYDKSTSPGPEDGWTSWLIHDAGDDWDLDYVSPGSYGADRVSGFTNGVSEYDNFSMVPEPATMSLLVIGGLALLRRRRK